MEQHLIAEHLLKNPSLLKKVWPKWNKYIPVTPHPKQLAFLMYPGREAFYGGSAGPGKSAALLMAALQYVDVPGYSAVLLRRTWSQLTDPGGLIPRSTEWLGGTNATWNETKKLWSFPSGAVIQFKHMEHPDDRYNLKGIEAQFFGYDELSEFEPEMYLYCFSRLRRNIGQEVPLRVRSASNPGGPGHEFIKQRFVNPMKNGRSDPEQLCLLAKLEDNPSIDAENYRKGLEMLPFLERKRLLDGDWDVAERGTMFSRSWFIITKEAPPTLAKVRAWDLAASTVKRESDPDYTVGALIGIDSDGIAYVLDIKRIRGTPLEVEHLVRATAQADGPSVPVFIEQEPGSSGLSVMEHYEREVLRGFTFEHERSTGSKGERAKPWSAHAERGWVKILDRDWNEAFLSEHEGFTGEKDKSHDDIVDACSSAFSRLNQPVEFTTESFLASDEYTEHAIERMLSFE